MASCGETADQKTKAEKDMYSETAHSEKEVCTSMGNVCRLVHCGESHVTGLYLRA